MKIIDLLNKIANGEEVPKKIYCFNRNFYLKGNTYFGDTFALMHYIQEEDLNDEVEILEEENQKLVKVIDELEKYICSKWYCFDNESVEFEVAKDILNKLTELKGGDKND